MADMMRLLSLMCHRGSRRNNVRMRSAPAIQEIMDMMEEKYNLRTNEFHGAGVNRLAPNINTLRRIASAFPTIVVDIFENGHGKVIFPPIENPNQGIMCTKIWSMVPRE